MKEVGWICLHRVIQKHWIWEDPVKLKWWLDILMTVNFKESKKIIGNDVVVIERGSMFTSIVLLAEKWGVDRKTAKKFLDLLKKDNMITLETSKKGTMLKVSNYADYQGIFSNEVDNSMDNSMDNDMDNNIHNSVDKGVDITMDNSMDNTMVNGMDTIKQYNNINNYNNYNQEEEREEQPTLQNSICPTLEHEKILKIVGYISYNTWFTQCEIRLENDVLIIESKNEMAINLIKNRYLILLQAELGIKVNLRSLDIAS